jgi:hypothetical protein
MKNPSSLRVKLRNQTTKERLNELRQYGKIEFLTLPTPLDYGLWAGIENEYFLLSAFPHHTVVVIDETPR